ncbi:hypothetical protein KCP78_00955 [Salmonella enterica subsp. enterica]|nr:hypothetical protein KCP78_00955 [Salmonella enterica subsp. enterica]
MTGIQMSCMAVMWRTASAKAISRSDLPDVHERANTRVLGMQEYLNGCVNCSQQNSPTPASVNLMIGARKASGKWDSQKVAGDLCISICRNTASCGVVGRHPRPVPLLPDCS